ncbi:MAG: DNA adenine methylase [Myxococcales bacterium]|nr:DNA adenine methylase [Myxococcales bacterium]
MSRSALLPCSPPLDEDSQYLSNQLLTYIGNKRALLAAIEGGIREVKHRLNQTTLRVADLFAGSGVVSRLLKRHARYLVSNDFEAYAAVVARCFLANRSSVDMGAVQDAVHRLNQRVSTQYLPRGFISELYAPEDEHLIRSGERVFFTPENARRIDDYRRMIEGEDSSLRDFLLAPLLSAASVHANTSGVFKGFYKDRETGIGKYGGRAGDALTRICKAIQLQPPVLSKHECKVDIFQCDANALAGNLSGLDLVYLDPPYNQHPYGSNYFMLNLITHYQRPDNLSRVSGIPVDWQRSGYNVRARSLSLLMELIETLQTKYILLSFNNEGFISKENLIDAISTIGRIEVMETTYNTFRGSRNLKNRSAYVTEYLFLIEKNGP